MPLTVAVKSCAAPGVRVTICGATCTPMPGFTVTVASADFIGFACGVLTTWKTPCVATVGAVYSPAELMVPPAAPSRTDQVTAWFELPITSAANCCSWFIDSVTLAGLSVTVTGLITVTAARPGMPPSTEVATTWQVAGVEGGEYRPVALTEPHEGPSQAPHRFSRARRPVQRSPPEPVGRVRRPARRPSTARL